MKAKITFPQERNEECLKANAQEICQSCMEIGWHVQQMILSTDIEDEKNLFLKYHNEIFNFSSALIKLYGVDIEKLSLKNKEREYLSQKFKDKVKEYKPKFYYMILDELDREKQ